MRKLQTSTLALAILAFAFFFTPALRAQLRFTADQVTGLQPVDPAALPRGGTFYFLVGPNAPYPSPPLPCPPGDMPGVPIYDLGNRHYLIDDSQVDYAALREQREMNQALRTLESQLGLDSPAPLDQGGSSPLGMQESLIDTNHFWLSIEGVTNQVCSVTLHATTQDQTYQLQSTESLTNPVTWIPEGQPFLGLQDTTPASVVVGTRTNALFLRAQGWVDSTGSGVPDWWWQQYFGTDWTNWADPYADPDGDGWSNLQEYRNGTSPVTFDTPPPPKNVIATVDTTGTNVTVRWESGGGPVASYTVEYDYGSPIQEISASSSSVAFGDPILADLSEFYIPSYVVQANFIGGGFARSEPVSPARARLDVSDAVVRGPSGAATLALQSPPVDLSQALLTFLDWPDLRTVAVDASDFLDGIAPLSDLQVDWNTELLYGFQAVATNGDFGGKLTAPLRYMADERRDIGADPLYSFVNAGAHLKENLKFLLRSATLSQPFKYSCKLAVDLDPDDNAQDPEDYFVDSPETCFARPASPSGYEYSGYHFFSSNLNRSVEQEWRPVQDHFLWRNFVYDSADFNASGSRTNGVGYSRYWPDLRLLWSPKYQFTAFAGNPPLAFSCTNSPWLYARWVHAETADELRSQLAELGLQVDADGLMYLATGIRNAFGLPVQSVLFHQSDSTNVQVVVAGGPHVHAGDLGDYYPQTELPVLQTVDHYFASETPYFNYRSMESWSPYGGAPPPLPGAPTFLVANASPLLLTGFGQPITVSGWAKMAITNGYADKFAYLEQYFDKALKIDDSGKVTTNETGILSPYGEFFPTEPGPVALVTMPEIDTGQRGTGVVNVIKLQLDVNHDGNLDLSFGGPDNTSQAHPLVWWINNDCDWAARTLSGSPAEVGRDISVLGGELSPNYDYRDTAIRSQRDLEDYARLWICGVPALPADQGYQVTLSLSNASTSTFAVNLVNSVEADGGSGYLTDPNVSAAQVAYSDHTSPGYKFARLTTSQSYTFPDNYFTNNATKHFLFEGAGIGSGQLVLTITQNATNVVAQTSAWLDLRDVKNMYEQVHISGVTNAVPPTSGFLSSSYQQLNWVDAGSDGDTNIIVFVHGWRMGVWDYYNFSESMFKRLYWQGYRGRFVSIRWDTLSKDDFKFFSTLQAFTTYNSSEYRAWESAKGVSDYLTSLKQRFPNYNLNVCSHSMGGIVMAEALKLQLVAGQHNVNNYVLMQAAVPASCYDTSFTNYAPFLSAEATQPTPNRYWGYPGVINGAVNGHLFDFYNTNDFALATGTVGGYPVSWEANQKSYKPDDPKGYTTDGTNCFVSPWNQTYRTVTESHEIMSFCARPRSKAVGAQPNVGGVVFTAGQIDLTGAFNFLGNWDEHSAEFNWNIQRLNGFYRQLGISLGVLQPSTP